jgi:hypothetical protein
MQKLFNFAGLFGALGTTAVLVATASLIMNAPTIKQRLVNAMQDELLEVVESAVMDQLPQAWQVDTPELPTETGPAIPFAN